MLQGENELVEAHKLAEEGAEAFPESPGGKLCYNLMRQIEAKSASITTERVWNQPWPTIQVRYRNVTQVYFRAGAAGLAGAAARAGRRPEWLEHRAASKALLAKKPDLDWAAALPPTDDYRERTEELPVPEGPQAGLLLPPGQPRSRLQRAEQRGLDAPTSG